MKVKRMNRLNRLLILGLVFLSTSVVGQGTRTPDQKKIDKCWKVFKTKSMSKGIAKLEKYMASTPFSSYYAYESLVRMEHSTYMQQKGSFTISVEGETAEKTDSLNQLFQGLLAGLQKTKFINVCRRSTLESTSSSGDMHLRKLMVDFDPDTVVSEKAKSYYDEGEEFFGAKDFELAELNYRKAINEEENYYHAYLYLGDTFWAREVYDSAIVYFEEAKRLQPRLLEPRIYIIDALNEQGLYYRAKKECIEALTVYPGYNLKYKLQRILTIENKYLNERRIMRTFYPNEIGNDNQISMANNPVWSDYREAKEDVSKYCNEDGIIEPNGEFDDRYLEVYSMRRMLDRHPNDLPEELHFADKMKEEGYLEPYVFVCLFHYDIHAQFEDYMSSEENRAKTIEFVEKYIIDAVPN